MCYNMWRLKGEIDMTMNTRLEMLYSKEEEYDRLKSEIRNYYINAITTATNEEELSNVKKDFNKFQETIKRLEKIKRASIGVESRLIIVSSLNSKLGEILNGLVPVQTEGKSKCY